MQSLILTRYAATQILNERFDEHMGSVWDLKPFGKSQEPLINLRYTVAVARIEFNKTYGQIRQQFGVSDGFTAKWSKVYAAHKTLVRTSGSWPKDQIRMHFASISNRPKNVSCPIQDRIRRDVLERRWRYGFEGADRIKAITKVAASTGTINKVLRKAGLMGIPKKRHRNLSHGRYERAIPNDLWHTDFKTWEFDFGTVHTTWIIDDASRYILNARITLETSVDIVIDMLGQA